MSDLEPDEGEDTLEQEPIENAVSGTSFIGFLLVLTGVIVILLPVGVLYVTVGTPESTITGVTIGLTFGGLLTVSGLSLLGGKRRFASYVLLITGIEYSAIELLRDTGDRVPTFLILGIVFFGLGIWYRAEWPNR